MGYNIDVLRQTACLVVNPIQVNSLHDGRSGLRLNDIVNDKYFIQYFWPPARNTNTYQIILGRMQDNIV